MEESDRNTIINFRYVGALLMVVALILSFIAEKSPLPQGIIFFMGLSGFVLMAINNFKGAR
ncbi:MAG: hypothetical protein CL504_05740 [Actinobacteria bacterium]|jgi:hypothetical protein|nr:hypothetical protein [Actinomycetota bacterium]